MWDFFLPLKARKPASWELAGRRRGYESCLRINQPQEFRNTFDFVVYAFGTGSGVEPQI